MNPRKSRYWLNSTSWWINGLSISESYYRTLWKSRTHQAHEWMRTSAQKMRNNYSHHSNWLSSVFLCGMDSCTTLQSWKPPRTSQWLQFQKCWLDLSKDRLYTKAIPRNTPFSILFSQDAILEWDSFLVSKISYEKNQDSHAQSCNYP